MIKKGKVQMSLEKGNESKKPILAPLYIVKEEKLYLIWVGFVIFFGLINVWAGLLLGKFEDVSSAFYEGIVYTYSISICAPFLAEVLLKQVVKKKSGERTEFVSYQVSACAFNIILILVLTFLWLGTFKSNTLLQIFLGIISSLFSFYMYCIGQMELHKGIVGEYDDDEYLKDEKNRMNKTEKSAKKIKKIEDKEGEIIL